jgi:hypothetical protein
MSTQGVHSQPISRYPEKAVKTFAHVGSSSRQVHPSGQPKTDHNFAELESRRFTLLPYSKQPQQIFRFKSRYHHDPISVGCDYLHCLTRARRCLRHNFDFQQSLLRLPVTSFLPQIILQSANPMPRC